MILSKSRGERSAHSEIERRQQRHDSARIGKVRKNGIIGERPEAKEED